MKTKCTLLIGLIIATACTAFGIFRETQPVQARIATAPPAMAVDPTPTPCPVQPGPECYSVLPSDTDGSENDNDCYVAIGCDEFWTNPNDEQSDANNNKHYFYLPPLRRTDTGKLLVLLGGGEGNAEGISTDIGPFAAGLGFHVIGLTYPAAPANSCGSLACFGDAFHEVVTGEERSPSAGGDKTTVGVHSQDSIATRLLRVLQWAHANYPDDGWGKYLINNNTAVNWVEIHIGGHSNGSSHSSYMGSLPQFQAIGRVSLFAGPDDGKDGDGTTEATWNPATYIQDTQGNTGERYYGLVHYLNKARKLKTGELNEPEPAYQVYKNWHTFGMEGPNNQDRFDEFDPEPGYTPNFGNAHMLISIDPVRDVATNMPPWGTTKGESHNSVVKNVYCIDEEEGAEDSDQDGFPGDHHCEQFGNRRIGYEPAWRCVLGSGDEYASTEPVADAGPDQTVECQGDGGANVDLNGSGSSDPDCDVLSYTWTGPFGVKTGRNPSVFLPVGTSVVTLVVSDGWPSSTSSDTTSITVMDTQPPTISCPADIVVEPTCSSGAVVTYTTPVGADGCTEAITTRTAGLASGSIFPIGTTTVTYTATDASNNTASCSFTVKVLTAAEVVQDLINRVQALQPPLSGQQAQGLRSKLNAALVAMDRDQKNVACNKLNDFINQVQTYINNGKLTSAQGQPLINSAAHVRNTLGCTALGCT